MHLRRRTTLSMTYRTTTFTLLPYLTTLYHNTHSTLDGSTYKKDFDRYTKLSHNKRPCILADDTVCKCQCSCCIPKDVDLDNLETYEISIHASQATKKQQKLWDKIMPHNQGNAKIIGLDRRELWQLIEHPLYCDDRSCYCNYVTCKDKFCVCRCQCCVKSNAIKDDDDRYVHEWWLYYAKQLRLYMDSKDQPKYKRILMTIDPWSLQQLWYCSPCNKYSVVEVYNNKGYSASAVFYVCLDCLSMYDLTERNNELRLTYTGKYDLC